MDVHARLTEVSELKALQRAFQVHCRRPEGSAAWARSMTGLLTALPNNPCDPTAQAIPGPREPPLPECLTALPGDEEDLHRQQGQQLTAETTWGHGVLGRDDPGVRQPGKTSVGVARQDSGTLGTGGTCQIVVTGWYPAP